MQSLGLISYGWQMAFIGMFAVFAFLWFLTVLINITSVLVQWTEKKDLTDDEAAATIAIALHQGEK